MRDHVLFYVNGQRHQIRGEAAFTSLTDFLRQELRLTGTKVVCAEGDCGACTVLVGLPGSEGFRYQPVDACIQFLYQLDGKHVITIEGLCGMEGELHPVQQAMIDCHGSQCGFCTPGFVMALAGYFEEPSRPEASSLQTALTGNLCRCTGYLPILNAGRAVGRTSVSPLANRASAMPIFTDLKKNIALPVLIPCAESKRIFFAPRRLEDAVSFKTSHPETVIVSGGTELGVLRNKKGFDPPTLLSLAQVPGLDTITVAKGTGTLVAAIGANVTWTQVERFAQENLPEFYPIILRFGSPQIRNVSTLVANVAHGSPIADSLPFLCVMDAEVEMVGPSGSRRMNINRFYKGYKVKDLAADEIITRVWLPLPDADDLVKLYKVSRRNDLDIATFGAAIRLRRAGEVITRAQIAYSGVAPTVVRLPATEAFLQGKCLTEATFREAGRLARSEIQPISDVRGSRDFRLALARNILVKFFFESDDGTVNTNHENTKVRKHEK